MRTPLCITAWPCLGSNSELLPKITEFGVWRYYVLLYMRLLSILFCCFKGSIASIAFMLLRANHIQLVIKQLIRKLHMFQEIWRKEAILLKSKGFCKKKKKVSWQAINYLKILGLEKFLEHGMDYSDN